MVPLGPSLKTTGLDMLCFSYVHPDMLASSSGADSWAARLLQTAFRNRSLSSTSALPVSFSLSSGPSSVMFCRVCPSLLLFFICCSVYSCVYFPFHSPVCLTMHSCLPRDVIVSMSRLSFVPIGLRLRWLTFRGFPSFLYLVCWFPRYCFTY